MKVEFWKASEWIAKFTLIQPFGVNLKRSSFGALKNYEQVVYIRERCSHQQFMAMFPSAKSFTGKKKSIPPRNRFQRTTKLFEVVFTQVDSLNYYLVMTGGMCSMELVWGPHCRPWHSGLPRPPSILIKQSWQTTKKPIFKHFQILPHSPHCQQAFIDVRYPDGVNMIMDVRCSAFNEIQLEACTFFVYFFLVNSIFFCFLLLFRGYTACVYVGEKHILH